MSLPDVVDKNINKLYSMHLLSSSLSSFTQQVHFVITQLINICFVSNSFAH